MKKILAVLTLLMFCASFGYAVQLTDDQRERLNEIGAPSSISSSFQTKLGDWLDALTGGGAEVSVAAGTLAIPVVDSTNGRPVAFVQKEIGTSESMTLADGVSGQIMTITIVTDAGTSTLTPATTGNFSSCTLSDLGDTVTLRFGTATASKGWYVIASASAAGGEVACTF